MEWNVIGSDDKNRGNDSSGGNGIDIFLANGLVSVLYHSRSYSTFFRGYMIVMHDMHIRDARWACPIQA